MPLKRLERGKMTSIFEYNKEEEDKKLYEAGIERGIMKVDTVQINEWINGAGK